MTPAMLLFRGGAFVALLVVLHYMGRTEGWRSASILLSFLVGMSALRELTVVRLSEANHHVVPYSADPTLGRVGGVNVVVVAGWVFTTMLSFAIAKMVQRRSFPGTNVFLTLALTALVTTTISYVVEITGMRMHLWRWQPEAHAVRWLPFDWPFDAFEGWASTSFLFMLVYCALRYRLFSSRRWVSVTVTLALVLLSGIADLAQPLLGPESPRKKVMGAYMLAAVVLGVRAPKSMLGSSAEALRDVPNPIAYAEGRSP